MKKLQCKDIPTYPILKLLAKNPSIWHNWFFGDDLDLSNAMPESIPDKLKLAKLRQLRYKNYIDGCICGCRGDFVLMEKGLKYINDYEIGTK